jgi:hypothetical protein
MPDSNMKGLVKVIEVEQSISARVLRLANSTYYGLSGKVSSIQQASVLLGYKTPYPQRRQSQYFCLNQNILFSKKRSCS